MGHLLYAVALAVGQHVGFILQRCKGVIGCTGHGYTTLESIRVVVYHTIQRIGRTAYSRWPICYR